MTLTIPSLSSIFSSLTKSVPATPAGTASAYQSLSPQSPAVPQLSAPQIGPSSLSSLNASGVKAATPVVPSLASTAAPTPNATSTITKAPVYIAPNQTQPANSTSAITKLPTYSPPTSVGPVPNSTSVATQQPVYSPPTAPAVPNITTPTATVTPAYTPPAVVTMNSGAKVDPATGSVVTNDGSAATGGVPFDSSSANIGNAGGISDYSTSAGGAPALPSTGGTDESNPLLSNDQDQAAYDAYIASLTPSADEVTTQKNLNALNSSAAQAYTDASGQPIALPFITGQQAQLQREQATLANPLESTLALLQAQRQATSTGAKAALDRQDSLLAAKRDLATKTVTPGLGATTYAFDPASGSYQPIDASAAGTSANATQLVSTAYANGQIPPGAISRYMIPIYAATLAIDPGYNFVTQKASIGSDSASLKTQQAYADSTSRAFNTANANLSQLVTFMTTNGVNDSTVPAINQLQNAVKSGLTDAGTIAAFNAGLAGLRAEYAQVLSRGGEVTEGQRAQANALIPDDISPVQLQQVADRLNIEGTNAVSEAQSKVNDILTRLKANPGGSDTPSSSSSSSSSDVGDSWASI